MHPAPAGAQPEPHDPGPTVRTARLARGLTLVALGKLTGYSAAQISRYERGITPLTVAVLHRFAAALSIPPPVLGLASPAASGQQRHGRVLAVPAAPSGSTWSTVAGRTRQAVGQEEGDVRRRQLLASLAFATAGAVTADLPAGSAGTGEIFVSRVRDAMLGLAPAPRGVSPAALRDGLDAALADFRQCRYTRLAKRLPRLITAGHLLCSEDGDRQSCILLAAIY
ncbi:MAG: helix-turn-helix transcriptional regulator, partial [Streptosporangiaceae bacterium]